MIPSFHSLKVADVRAVTDEAMSIAFAVPPDLKDAYRFLPGQYLTLKAQVNGEELRRSYSICSTQEEGELRVAVKRVPAGRFSNFANEAIRVGDAIEVMTPMGNFHTALDPAAGHHYVGFAGGSGITPFMSIIKTVLRREPESSFTLFYGNRRIAAIMFREDLEDLKDRFLGRFRLFHILSDERPDLDLFHGLLDEDKAGRLIDRLVDPGSVDMFFICGPAPMMDAARAALSARGVEEARQKYELFGAPPPQAGAKPAHAGIAGRSAEVEIVLNGARRTFRMAKEGESILEAAIAENMEPPYSCQAGVCSTCRARLVEGEVRMDAAHGLEPDEVEKGYILTCQSHPLSDKLVVDYDQ